MSTRHEKNPASDADKKPMSEADKKQIYESNAKEFIAAEMSRLFWNRLGALAAVIGIANIAAIITIWASVKAAAIEEAKISANREAQSVARNEIKTQVEVLKSQTHNANTDLDKIHNTFSSILVDSGAAQERLKRISADADTFKTQLDQLQKFEGHDLNRLLPFIEKLAEHPDTEELVRQLELQAKMIEKMEIEQIGDAASTVS